MLKTPDEIQTDYEQILSQLAMYVDTSEKNLKNAMNKVGSEFKISESRGMSSMTAYNTAQDELYAAKSAHYYYLTYVPLFISNIKLTGDVDRYDSEWSLVYNKIISDTSYYKRKKVQFEKSVTDKLIQGINISQSEINKIIEYKEQVMILTYCKYLHNQLFDLIFNYNSQVVKYKIGTIKSMPNRAGLVIPLCPIIEICTKDQLSKYTFVTPLETILSSLEPPYNQIDENFTLFYVFEESQSSTTTDEEGNEITTHTSLNYLLWDNIILHN